MRSTGSGSRVCSRVAVVTMTGSWTRYRLKEIAPSHATIRIRPILWAGAHTVNRATTTTAPTAASARTSTTCAVNWRWSSRRSAPMRRTGPTQGRHAAAAALSRGRAGASSIPRPNTGRKMSSSRCSSTPAWMVTTKTTAFAATCPRHRSRASANSGKSTLNHISQRNDHSGLLIQLVPIRSVESPAIDRADRLTS